MNCVYKICSTIDNIDCIYIGYTKNLKHRKAVHLSKCKKDKYNKVNLYKYMLEHGIDNFQFIPLIELESYNREALKKLEKIYYELYNPELNIRYPTRTCKEYQKDNYSKFQVYRQSRRHLNNILNKARNQKEGNKEIIRNRASLYYAKNKDALHKRNISSFHCACGQSVKYYNRKTHKDNIAHKTNLLENLESTIKNKFKCLIHL